MSEIEELQSRITSAMERIGAGLTVLSEKSSTSAESDQAAQDKLTAQLDEERLVNGQLEERLTTVISKHEAEIVTLKAELDTTAEMETIRTEQATQSQAMARLDMDVQRLRQANDQLRDSNAALREANEQGVGEPHLINKAMLAELEGLRASRATDAAEASAVLAKLGPLLAGAQNLVEGEDA